MKQYDYVLFDWDGCLAKTLEVWVESYRDALAARGIVASDKDIGHYLGDYKIAQHFGVEDYEALNDIAVAAARRALRTVELYIGAKEVLLQVGMTKKLALVTSGSRDIVENGLRHNGLTDAFDFIITGDDVTDHKPHPESLEKALLAIGGSKESAIMIGDSNKDIGAATNFGIDSVLVYHPSHDIFYDLESLQDLKPTYTIHSFTELASLLG